MEIEHPISEGVAETANWCLEEGRTRLCMEGDTPGAVVLGRHSDYQVWFHPEGVSCDCRAGADHGWTEPRCGHVVAAMCCWADALEGRPWHPNGFLG